jgi:hypothetical protein
MALTSLGEVYAELGALGEACEHFEAACCVVETIRQDILSDETRASFFATVQPSFQGYISTLMRRHHTDPQGGDAATAFHVCERGRARAFLDLLAESGKELWQGLDPKLAQQRADLLAELASVQHHLLQSAHDRQQWLRRRDDLELRLDQLEARIRAAHPRYAAYTRPEPLTLAQIQDRLLGDHTALLAYTLGLVL